MYNNVKDPFKTRQKFSFFPQNAYFTTQPTKLNPTNQTQQLQDPIFVLEILNKFIQ